MLKRGYPSSLCIYSIIWNELIRVLTSIITLKIERNTTLFVSGGGLDISLQRNISQYLHSHLQNKNWKNSIEGKKQNSHLWERKLVHAKLCVVLFSACKLSNKERPRKSTEIWLIVAKIGKYCFLVNSLMKCINQHCI